jgi:phenylpropionate dioxygenase-like ring-hydroxylating dioxygenase large terminal subunit
VSGLASGTAQGTLPWSWYSDPELLRQERVFRRGWHYAGPAEHAAERGSFFTCEVGAVPVVVTRDREGGLTRGFLDYLFPEDVPDEQVDELLAFDDRVGLEDRALVESVQSGVRSGLLGEGRLLPESEQLLAHFQRLVREALA